MSRHFLGSQCGDRIEQQIPLTPNCGGGLREIRLAVVLKWCLICKKFAEENMHVLVVALTPVTSRTYYKHFPDRAAPTLSLSEGVEASHTSLCARRYVVTHSCRKLFRAVESAILVGGGEGIERKQTWKKTKKSSPLPRWASLSNGVRPSKF